MPDRPSTDKAAIFSGLGADLRSAAAAIGWLAGSMSGVVAVMYAVGFLCAKSHLSTLGIELYSGLTAGGYVEIGAKFFYISTLVLFEGLVALGSTLLPIMGAFILLVLGTGLVCAVIVAYLKRSRLRAVLRSWLDVLTKWGPDSTPGRIFLSGLLALVLVWSGSQYKEVFAPVQVSDVLHQKCTSDGKVNATNAIVAALICRMRAQDHAVTRSYYSGLLKLVFGLFLVVVPFRKRFLKWKESRLFYLPLTVLFTIYVLVMPLNYGAIIIPKDFPKVELFAKKGSQIRLPQGPLYLIHQGEKSLILWHNASDASYVIPASEIVTLKVIGRSSLFSEQAPDLQTTDSGGAP